jgi:hypothetical protein
MVVLALPMPLCVAQDSTDTETRQEVLKVSATSAADRAATRRHTLADVIQLARQHQQFIHESVHDFTCYLVRRERIEDELLDSEHMFVKFRGPRQLDNGDRVPFSVYLRVLAPKKQENREVLYVSGRNRGDVIVTRGGRRNATLTFHLDPLGRMALRDNKYPITAFGLENLMIRAIDVLQEDLAFADHRVRIMQGAKVDGRSCTVYEVNHPVPQPHFRFHIAQVFIDDEMQLPIRYAAYGWPDAPSGEPSLLEEYTYRQMRVNVGLTDADFDPANPEYRFSQRD